MIIKFSEKQTLKHNLTNKLWFSKLQTVKIIKLSISANKKEKNLFYFIFFVYFCNSNQNNQNLETLIFKIIKEYDKSRNCGFHFREDRY